MNSTRKLNHQQLEARYRNELLQTTYLHILKNSLKCRSHQLHSLRKRLARLFNGMHSWSEKWPIDHGVPKTKKVLCFFTNGHCFGKVSHLDDGLVHMRSEHWILQGSVPPLVVASACGKIHFHFIHEKMRRKLYVIVTGTKTKESFDGKEEVALKEQNS